MVNIILCNQNGVFGKPAKKNRSPRESKLLAIMMRWKFMTINSWCLSELNTTCQFMWKFDMGQEALFVGVCRVGVMAYQF